jgi:hypothetical protein
VQWFAEYAVCRGCVPTREEIDDKLAEVMRDVPPGLADAFAVPAGGGAFFDRLHPDFRHPIIPGIGGMGRMEDMMAAGGGGGAGAGRGGGGGGGGGRGGGGGGRVGLWW